MANDLNDFVVGGIGKPRILVIDDNIIPDHRFNNAVPESEPDGWDSSSEDLTVSGIEDVDAYSENMMRMLWNESIQEYVEFEQLYNQPYPEVDKYLVAFRIKDVSLSSPRQSKIVLEIREYDWETTTYSVNQYTEYFEIDSTLKRLSFVFEGLIPSSQTARIRLRIFTADGFTGAGDIRIDDVYLCPVESDNQFDCPQENFLIFEQRRKGGHEKEDGSFLEYNRSYKPNYIANWESMTKSNEEKRQWLSETPNRMFVMPHLDFAWGFMAKWLTDFQRRYSYDRYIGHDSVIRLVGDELMIGTISPVVDVYEPPPVLVTVNITSNITVVPVLVICTADYNEDSEGVVPLNRIYEDNTLVTLNAPSSVTIDEEVKNFQDWYDEDGDVVLGTVNVYTFTITGVNKKYVARYETAVIGGGYGTGYGSGYGTRL